MSKHRGGVVDGDQTYTQWTLATALAREPEWVVENVIDQGCPARLIGNIYMISGTSFRMWCEMEAVGTTSKQHRRRKRDNSMGGEA